MIVSVANTVVPGQKKAPAPGRGAGARPGRQGKVKTPVKPVCAATVLQLSCCGGVYPDRLEVCEPELFQRPVETHFRGTQTDCQCCRNLLQ